MSEKKSPLSPVCLGSLSLLFTTSSTEAEVQSQKQLFKTLTMVTSVSLENLMGEALITKLSILNISGQHNCRRGWGWRYIGFVTFYTSQRKMAQSPLSWKLLGFSTSPAPGYHLQRWPVLWRWAARCLTLTRALMTSPLTINSNNCNIFRIGYQRAKHQILLPLASLYSILPTRSWHEGLAVWSSAEIPILCCWAIKAHAVKARPG